MISNSIGIYFIGGNIEWIFGSNKLARIFLSGAILGGLVQLNVNFKDNPMIGSSNGVSSLLGYFIANFPKSKIYILPFPIPISAWVIGASYFYVNYKNFYDY